MDSGIPEMLASFLVRFGQLHMAHKRREDQDSLSMITDCIFEADHPPSSAKNFVVCGISFKVKGDTLYITGT